MNYLFELSYDEIENLSSLEQIKISKAKEKQRAKKTPKDLKVLVFANGKAAADAKRAGADFVGGVELCEKINSGWTDFDVVIATPSMMGVVCRVLKTLTRLNLMPSPRSGTLTTDVVKAVEKIKGKKPKKNLNHSCTYDFHAKYVYDDKSSDN